MTPHLADDLRRDEGIRLKAYPDPASGRDPYTIGYGHVGPEVFPGVEWTLEQCEDALRCDIERACAGLDAKLPWWRNLNDARQDCMVFLAFNLGIGHPPIGKEPGRGLLSFVNTLAAIKRGSYAIAAEGLRNSKWARQVHGRAERIARQVETGIRQETKP